MNDTRGPVTQLALRTIDALDGQSEPGLVPSFVWHEHGTALPGLGVSFWRQNGQTSLYRVSPATSPKWWALDDLARVTAGAGLRHHGSRWVQTDRGALDRIMGVFYLTGVADHLEVALGPPAAQPHASCPRCTAAFGPHLGAGTQWANVYAPVASDGAGDGVEFRCFLGHPFSEARSATTGL